VRAVAIGAPRWLRRWATGVPALPTPPGRDVSYLVAVRQRVLAELNDVRVIKALFSGKPPFTAAQLDALSAGDEFHGVDTLEVFGVAQTPFEAAVRESYCDPGYSGIVLRR